MYNVDLIYKVKIITVAMIVLMITPLSSQNNPSTFGKGINFYAADSSYHLKFALWTQTQVEYNSTPALSSSDIKLIQRRTRLRFQGYLLHPDFQYNVHLGLSNRDTRGGDRSEMGYGSNVVYDIFLRYHLTPRWMIQYGQHKMVSNMEFEIGPPRLVFPEMSILHSAFTMDRDRGLILGYKSLSKTLPFRAQFFISSGEGRNITDGNFDGLAYSLFAEIMPLGAFTGKGAYMCGAFIEEEKPKLILSATLDINNNAVRSKGRNGNFLSLSEQNYAHRDLYSFYANMMFKYKRFTLLTEYVHRHTANNEYLVLDINDTILGHYFTGYADHLQLSYLIDSTWELACRYSGVYYDELISGSQKEYVIGITKYAKGHPFKFQLDFSLIDHESNDNQLRIRFMSNIHF